MANGNKKRRKRRSPIGYIIVIVILATLMSLLIFEHFHPIKKLPVGTWVRAYDLTPDTDQATDEWLLSATSGLTEIPKSTHDSVTIDVVLKINADGTYERYIDGESYAAAVRTAYSNMESALKSVITARFTALGMADEKGLTDDEIDSLMQEAVGMSMADYLRQAVPGIVPPMEALSQDLAGTGVCRIEEDQIIFDDGAGQMLLYDNGRMMIDDEVYTGVQDD